jgi:hypothetical protein
MNEEATEISPTWLIIGIILIIVVTVVITLLFSNPTNIPACPSCPACSPSLSCYGGNVTINVTCQAPIIQINTTEAVNTSTGRQYYISVSEGMSMEANG